MRIPPAASYTLRRLGLFLGTLGLAVVLMRGVPFVVSLAVATVVSSVLSYFLLAGPREAMARAVAGKVGAINERLESGAATEDAALDAAESERAQPSTGDSAAEQPHQ